LNIGAGDFVHPKWTNVDVSSDHYKGIQKQQFIEYDLTKNIPLPIDSNKVSLAYCSHTIEHVKNDNIDNLFSEIYRTMKKGGVFRITCPNADLFYSAALIDNFSAFTFRTNHWFVKNRVNLFDVGRADYLVRAFASQLNPSKVPLKLYDRDLLDEIELQFKSKDKESFFNWLTDQVSFDIKHVGSHINWWNYTKIEQALQKAGFELIINSSFGSSIAAPLRNVQKFDKTVPEESVYVDAIKWG
jgi:predicted SAM-dependent methyltransferase